MNKVIIQKSIEDIKTVNSQYLKLGTIFKLFKISTHHSEGSVIKMALNLPYYALFAQKMKRDLNLFLSDPLEQTLSTSWNFASVFLI